MHLSGVRVLAPLAALACVALLPACAFNINTYGASVDNVENIKRQNLPPVALGTFSATKPGVSVITCRGAGPVTTPGKIPYESYIEGALRDEFRLAGIYDPNSRLVLGGNLELVDFSSNIGVARWMLTLKLSSGDASYTTLTEHPFSTNYFGDKACQQVAQAFVPAVQQLIRDVVASPRFKSLFTP
jgi:hypothetical protein